MERKYFWIASFLLLFTYIILGCQAKQSTPAIETESTATISTAFAASLSPLSAPVSPISQPIPSPEPSTGKAAIYGRLLINDGYQTPLAETALYLTSAIGENNDQLPPLLVGVQEGDIRGFTDLAGQFAINDIPPGNYFLIIWAPLSWIPLHNVYNGEIEIILLQLQPDQIFDIGEKSIDWP